MNIFASSFHPPYMEKSIREILIETKKKLDANAFRIPSFDPYTLSGERFMSFMKSIGQPFNVIENKYLEGAFTMMMIGEDSFDLHVSPDVLPALVDANTCHETIKGLTVKMMPKFDRFKDFWQDKPIAEDSSAIFFQSYLNKVNRV